MFWQLHSVFHFRKTLSWFSGKKSNEKNSLEYKFKISLLSVFQCKISVVVCKTVTILQSQYFGREMNEFLIPAQVHKRQQRWDSSDLAFRASGMEEHFVGYVWSTAGVGELFLLSFVWIQKDWKTQWLKCESESNVVVKFCGLGRVWIDCSRDVIIAEFVSVLSYIPKCS